MIKLGICSVLLMVVSLPSQSKAVALPQVKCSLQDSACVTQQARLLLKPLVEGNPELGIEKLDTMFIKHLEIKEYGLDYEMNNVNVEGLKSAEIENVTVDTYLKNIGITFKTPLKITGNYTAKGFVFTMPVFGEGDFTLQIDALKVQMLLAYDIVQNKDRNEIIKLTRYTYGVNLASDVHFEYKKLFKDNKEKYNKLHALLHDYRIVMISRFGDYYFSKITENIFTAIQMYLASTNLNDLAIKD